MKRLSQEGYAQLKVKKAIDARQYNHPHRLGTINLTGSLNLTIDRRKFTYPNPGLSAYLYEYALDFSLATPQRRVFETFVPWVANGVTPTKLAPDEFVLSHRPLRRVWELLKVRGSGDSYEVIGTVTRTLYVRESLDKPWVSGIPEEYDIEFQLVLPISGGGEPASGGKGDSSTDEEATIRLIEDFRGDFIDGLPDFSTVIGRLPWDDSWLSESEVFATIFSDHISDGNTERGGGYSGSCGLTMHFGNINAPSADFSSAVNSQLLPLL